MLKVKYCLDVIKLAFAMIISFFYKFNKINEDIWLISERKGEARDNGYHLFKFIRQNYPKHRIYYVIDKRSTDLKKISYLGNIIYYDSLKHYIYYVISSKLVCGHLGSAVPDSPVCWNAEGIGLIKKKKIFIQHGITKELIESLVYKNTHVDLFVCGAKPEYDFVKSEFGYPLDSVKYLGFCRFDNLHNYKVKRQILIMPTWRKWFGMEQENRNNSNEFLTSQYYKAYLSILGNKFLHKILEENKYKLIFYPHHEMQRFIDYFKTDSSNIIIARESDYDVQGLLKESMLLITDYSSIAFDFAYMRKPMIYYQFDSEEYYEKHYQRGYFDYEENGFGPVIKTEDELIKEIKSLLNNKISVNTHEERINSFFPLFDTENSKRNYEAIFKA